MQRIYYTYFYSACKTIGYDEATNSVPVEVDGRWANSKSTLHMLFHILGRYHEHQRADKEKYVRVIKDNIFQGMKNVCIKCERIELIECYTYSYMYIYDK